MNSLPISLPVERLQQLQALAEKDGVSVADAVADLVRKAIFDGRLPDTLPGWKVERVGAQVHFELLETGIAKRWPLATAMSVADTLDKLATPGGNMKSVLDMDADVQFERRGMAVKLIDLATKEERAVARSIANDLASLIRKAAA